MRLLSVNYHYYRTMQTGGGIYPITPEQFATQVRQLAAEWSIASEAQMLEALDSGATDDVSLCLITFDDGLKEQMKAISWLIDNGYSAVCYVPTAPLVDRCMLAVHKLHIIRSLRSDDELSIDLQRLFGPAFAKLDIAAAAKQYPLDDAAAQALKYFLNFVLSSDESRAWIDGLFEEIAGDEAAAAAVLYMDQADLRFLAAHGMIGTHAHSHVPLAMLDEASVRREVEQSLDILETIAGVRVRGVSYPYGGPTAANEVVGRVAAACGLSYGLSMQSGVNGGHENRMLLKRIDTKNVGDFAGATGLTQ